MTTEANITAVYYGLREDMIAEVAAFDPSGFVAARQCKYLVMPMGDAQFDTEWFASRKEAREQARYIATHYAGCKVCSV